jgi:FkbM family methyltransferase
MLNWTFIRQVGPVQWATRYSALQFRKRVLKQDSRLLLPTGVRMTLPRQSRTSTEIYVTNANMDWGAEAIFAQFADPHRDFLDIGAHIGYYAAYLSPCVRRAYAFEPDIRNLPGLRDNASLTPNIEVVEMAVSSSDGVANFFGGNGSSVGSLNNVGGPVRQVTVTSVDTFVANHAGINVGLIKTDVEGHDLEALHGMNATVASFQPLILTECEMSSELIDLCSQWNYKIFATHRNKKSEKQHFGECKLDDKEDYGMKMLFLTPRSLHSAFAGLTVH